MHTTLVTNKREVLQCALAREDQQQHTDNADRLIAASSLAVCTGRCCEIPRPAACKILNDHETQMFVL